MEPITAIIQLFIYVTGSAATALTPFAITAAITDPQATRRLWRALGRHLSGLPATGRTITGHATGRQGGEGR